MKTRSSETRAAGRVFARFDSYLLSNIFCYSSINDLSVCLRISQDWFLIAGEELYRNLTVDLNQKQNSLVGLMPKDRKWRKGDFLPRNTNLKRLLLNKCRNLVVLEHESSACAKLSAIDMPCLRSISYPTYVSKEHRPSAAKLSNQCPGMALLAKFHSDSTCCLIPKIRPSSLVIRGGETYADKTSIIRHYQLTGDVSGNTASNVFLISSARVAINNLSVWSNYCYLPTRHLTIVFSRSPVSFYGEDIPTRGDSDGLWVEKWVLLFESICLTVKMLHLAAILVETSQITLCGLEGLGPAITQHNLRHRLLTNGQSDISLAILRHIRSSVTACAAHRDPVLMERKLDGVSMEEFVSSGQWKGVLAQEQAEPWLEYLNKLEASEEDIHVEIGARRLAEI